MSKLKLPKEVCDRLDDLKCMCKNFNDWKSEVLRLHTEALNNDVYKWHKEYLCMKDISIMELALILHSGWEAEKYTARNLPKMFNFKVKSTEDKHTAIVFGDRIHIAYEYDGVINSYLSTVEIALSFLNRGVWIVIQ